ncbi:class I SAM-dependent methyltransferase [Thermoflavifilum thermophilum]|uniref:Methyltransferase domain-containing protein n=1 Tax=Thermoflavifilum thermophilum TaxID=1393122 RepID=A0A1I7N3Y2_9BACT|nr:class I SAM-dependent methyltransferase [Thermoflavifilum thermophilum]SFV29368.1 Methyltransferase domain-containing protein [Thermoflavifilum thermophilum]
MELNVKQAYNLWATQYDTQINETRDLEAVAFRAMAGNKKIARALEMGCGTGKNTLHLLKLAQHVTAVDFSDHMLQAARAKIQVPHVEFVQADILQEWTFAREPYDWISFSLVLEHVEDVTDIFRKAAAVAAPHARLYVGELHPFRQYLGGKAQFDTPQGSYEVPAFTHHVSDFITAAHQNGWQTVDLREWFDDADRTTLPRILSLLFEKNHSPINE